MAATKPMAHLFETGMFTHTPAWHGLGVVLTNAPTVDEAIVAAGLNWGVRLDALTTTAGLAVADNYAVVRESDSAVLGVVGSEYTPVQNAEAFAWIRPIIESGEATIEAAGSLQGGRRVWILAAIKGAVAEPTPGDPVQSYVLFAHGHDGSLAVRAGFTTTRVVCQNTLTLATKTGASKLLKFRHTKNVRGALDAARAAFDVQRSELQSASALFSMLATKKLSGRNLVRYVRETLAEGAGNDDTIKVRNVDAIVKLAHESPVRAAEGTLWGGYNAVTEWATHERGRSADTRLNATWFGAGGELQQRALLTATAYAEKLPSNLVEQSHAAAQATATARLDFNALLGKASAVI